ncbi:MAG: S8 family serine peptidase [Longimicrobiales bacterium]
MSSGFTLDHPAFRGTGRSIRVAVIDSGVHIGNPHITPPVTGVHLTETGLDFDAVDRLGHGTAVSAAILEKAPHIEWHAYRVFDRNLATSAVILARAITMAADAECRLINLSLGTANPERAAVMRAAVDHATQRNAIIVSAFELNATKWLPGSLAGVAGVRLDSSCPRNELHIGEVDGSPVFMASGLPRPIPAVPPEQNLQGISFAVANVTGFLARLLESKPHLRTPRDVLDFLQRDAPNS